MSRTLLLRLLGVLALMFVLGFAAATTSSPGSHLGFMWPVGLASGVLVLAPRRFTAHLIAAVAVLAVISFAAGDYPFGVAVGYGIGIALEATVSHQILTARRSRRLTLNGFSDLGRYALGCALGALTAAVLYTATSALNDFGVPWRVGVACLVTHFASQAVVLSLFKDHVGPSVGYGGTERLFAWTLTIVGTVVAFVPTEIPSLAFLVIPLLGWVAFRAPAREATYQLMVVAVISSVMTKQGYGPFADLYLLDELDPEFRYLPLQAFLIACAMVSVPFSTAVAMQRRSDVRAVRERARSDRLVQSARGIAIIGTDPIGRINLFSPGAESILGYTPEEVFGQSTRMFHTEAELARHAHELGTDPTYVSVVHATGDLPPGTARVWQFVRKDGIPRTLSMILSPIHDDNDTFVGYVATCDDITDRIDAEAALEKALQTERRAVKRLTEIDQVKDAFISSVSHELRTPITNIVGYLELLMDGVYGDPTVEQTDAMSRIDMNSRRLLTLIDDLLTLSSMERFDQRRRGNQVDLVMVLSRALEIVRPSLLSRDLTFDVAAPSEPVPVIGHTGELERLVINLATNAVKFTPDGGRVAIRLLPADSEHGPVLEVEDTGIGIHEAERTRLFTRFFRTTHAEALGVPGSGLGLSIAKAIVDVHGGVIEAISVHGEGSTFRVTFPAAESAA